jgi:polysaccharide deacetylase 2 family uncharacterized protein YibQ
VSAASDDLTKPLGVDGPAPAKRRDFLRPLTIAIVGFAAAAFGALAIYVFAVDDPLGGEPHVTVAVEKTTAAPPGPTPAPQPGARVQEVPSDEPRRTATEVETASGVAVVRPDGTSAPGSVVIRVPDAPASGKLAPAPDRRLVERTRSGTLPKIGADGARPFDVYARPAGRLPGNAQPIGRVALLVGGLGIGAAATADAIAKLPPPVTLAFAPYGSDLERVVAQAREAGHEVMLQAPMEPFDYPDNDPGPHTLTAKAKPQENLDRLHWVMGRFAGYVGLVNFMGARLTADEQAFAPILREIGSRGLVFLDDGSSSRSIATRAGAATQTPTLRADIVLDAVPRADAIDQELAKLEKLAREKGLVIGTASALPLSIDRLSRWAKALETRGVLLVPVSAAFKGDGRKP